MRSHSKLGVTCVCVECACVYGDACGRNDRLTTVMCARVLLCACACVQCVCVCMVVEVTWFVVEELEKCLSVLLLPHNSRGRERKGVPYVSE